MRIPPERQPTLLAVLLSIASVVGVAVFLYGESQRRVNAVFHEAERQGEFLFNTMSQQVSDSLYFDDIERIRKDTDVLTAQQQVRRIAIFTDNGQFLLDTNQPKVPEG